MTDATRQNLLDLAFLEGPWTFCGSQLRPVTLGSLHVCHHIGVPILGRDLADKFAGLDRVEQARRFLKFMWVHEVSLPIDDMLQAVRSGGYAEQFAAVEESPLLCPLFNAWLHRFNQIAEAASFDIVERNASATGEATPDTVVDPAWLVRFIDPFAARYHWSEDEILWRLPFLRALQYRHRAIQASPFVFTVKEAPPPEDIAKSMAEAQAAVGAKEEADPNEV